MKNVTVIIKPSQLDPVKEALSGLGITGMTITEVKGFGQQQGQTEHYRGIAHPITFLPKTKIETVVDTGKVDDVISTITQAVRTSAEGAVGYGKIFVGSVEQAIRIRTGQRNQEAL